VLLRQVFQFLLPYANILWDGNQDENDENQNQDPPLGLPITEPPSRLQKKPRKKNPTITRKRAKKSTLEVIRDEEDEEREDGGDPTERRLSDDLLNKIFKTIDREIASMEAAPTPLPPKEKKTGNIHRSNPEYQIPLEINERMKQRTQKINVMGELFNWEHVLCAVQQSAESIVEKSPFSHLRDFGDDGNLDEEKLEEMFFQAMNAAECSEERRVQKSVEISPVLPPLHLTPKVVQRIQSRLIALFGMSRDATPLHRTESSKCRNYDFCSPGYPQSS
jgi:hypothetical protein